MDSTTTTPIYFILSPGANVVGDLDKLADKYEFVKNESYHNVSMGQGQVRSGVRKVDQKRGVQRSRFWLGRVSVSIQFHTKNTRKHSKELSPCFVFFCVALYVRV